MKKILEFRLWDSYAFQKSFRIMKVFLIIMFLGIAQLMAIDSYSQKIRLTLNMNQRTLVEVLDAIENQSDFYFLFNEQLINVNRKVSINVEDQDINKILTDLLEEGNINFQIVDRKIVLSPADGSIVQQNLKISGKVTDPTGTALPGVTVVVKGTTNGTITNFDGIYTLADIPADAIIQFSFVGMKLQEIKVSGETTIDVVMVEDAIGIEEVVAIGYGTMKKSDLTGSVVSADIEQFRQAPNTNITQSLSGSVPGLNVGQINSAGANPSLMIRGQNSISGSNTPLIVVDGIIYAGSLSSINSADVERVDILKDASSTAVYGARAANGVILITTKQSKSKTKKPIFNYSASYSLSTPSSMPTSLNAQQFYDKAKDIYWNDGGYLAPDYTEVNPDFDPVSVWIRNPLKEGWANGNNFDWVDAVTQTGHLQDHLFSVTNHNESSNYYISVGYTDQLGYIINDKYKRWTGRINIENKLTSWLDLGIRSYIVTEDYSGSEPALSNALRLSPLVSPYDSEGNLITYPDGQIMPNPFFSYDVDDFDKRLELNGTVYANIKVPFVKGLTYRVTMNNRYNTRRRFVFNQWANSQNGSAQKYNAAQFDWTLDQIINYKRTFEQDHNVDFTLVFGRSESTYENTDVSTGYFTNMTLGYNSLESGTSSYHSLSSAAWNENSLYSMGRLNYSYKSRYLLTLTLRKDGYSGFAENKKWGTFPSAALAWVLSEEDFVKENLPFAEYLKLRVSYGKNGNRTSRYSSLARVGSAYQYVYGDGSSPYMGQNIRSLSNQDLSWETTTGYNFGIDFVSGFLSGNIDYYNTNTTDLFWDLSLPIITGFSSILSNVGEVNNRGIEFSLTSTNIKTSDFTWETTLNFSRNRNELKDLIDIDGDGNTKDDLASESLFIGESLDNIYYYTVDGMYQLNDDIPSGYYPGTFKIKDLDGDGSITALNDRSIIGYTDPSYRFSISNTFKYKNLSLFIYVNSIQGGKNRYMAFNDPISSISGRDNVVNDNTFAEWDFWTPANPDATFARIDGATSAISPRVLQQRSFVRLQDVSLAYHFDNNILNKIGLGSMKVFFSGKNLFTWTKWKGWDPETGQGLTYTGRPVLKNYTLGLEISF